eukprot:2893608-Rhodomonas_salina.3
MGTYEISGTYLRAARPDPHYMQKTFSTAAHTINATTAQPRPTEQFMATQVARVRSHVCGGSEASSGGNAAVHRGSTTVLFLVVLPFVEAVLPFTEAGGAGDGDAGGAGGAAHGARGAVTETAGKAQKGNGFRHVWLRVPLFSQR